MTRLPPAIVSATLMLCCLAAPPREASAQEVETTPPAEENAAKEHHTFHAGLGTGAIVDFRDDRVRVGAGPLLTLEWRPLEHFAIELASGIAFGPPEPVVIVEVIPEIHFERVGIVEPFIGLGPVLSLEAAEETELAGGFLVAAGVDIWPWPGGALGFFAKAVYRLLGGPTLIHQAGANLGVGVRF